MSVDAKKTTQIEYLLSLSSAAILEKFLTKLREKSFKDMLAGTCDLSTLTTMQKHMIGSPEACAYLDGASSAVRNSNASAKDHETARQTIMNIFCAAFADGFAYAASLLDSTADEVIN